LHWHRGPLTLGASLYALDYRDFIYLADTGIEDGGVTARLWNQADSRFTGGELDLRWTVLDNDSGRWTLRGFGDVVRGRLTGEGTQDVAFAVPQGDHAHNYTPELPLAGGPRRDPPCAPGSRRRARNGAAGLHPGQRQPGLAPRHRQRPGAGAVRRRNQPARRGSQAAHLVPQGPGPAAGPQRGGGRAP